MAPNEREIKRAFKLANEVITASEDFKFLDEERLRSKSKEFRMRMNLGATEDELMINAFGVVREGSRRVTQTVHSLEQIAYGILLARGRAAQIESDEDKVLASALAAYVHCMSGKNVQVAAANDELARRNCELVTPVFEYLDVSVGLVLGGMTLKQRQEAYACDITYASYFELGMDYLRDGMAKTRHDAAQRDLKFVVVDEADFAADGALAPLVLSEEDTRTTKIYEVCDVLARRMTPGKEGDFTISETDQTIQLTEDGMARIERYFRVLNIGELKNLSLQYHMLQALRANHLLGTRYVQDGPQRRTIASITYQTFFSKYEKMGIIQSEGSMGIEALEQPTTYDEIVDIQRDIIFEQRREILFIGEVKDVVTRIINACVEDAFERAQYDSAHKQGVVVAQQFDDILTDFGRKSCAELEDIPLLNCILDELANKYVAIEASFSDGFELEERIRKVMLSCMDEAWVDHLEALEQLGRVGGFLDYGAVDPMTAYKRSATALFETLKYEVRHTTLTALLYTNTEEDVKRALRSPAPVRRNNA